uniref:DUF1907 domain-containing protein n=1 Tax=Pavo cristatus TaxID=9049 RepID=A0A8C9FTT9_PAVCR
QSIEFLRVSVHSLKCLAEVKKGLKENFADAQVSVVDCPDLTQEPFNFPAKGNLVPLIFVDLSEAIRRVQVVLQVKNLHERKTTFYSCICFLVDE